MGINVYPVPSSGMTTTRFPATPGAPFNVPAGLTLQNTVTSTTTFSAGSLPAQVWAVVVGGGGGGSTGWNASAGGGGGGASVTIGWVDVPSSGITAQIGAGGAGIYGAGSTGLSGNIGGNTSFGSVIAYGGGGGANPYYGPIYQNAQGRGPGAGMGGGNYFFPGQTTMPGYNIYTITPGNAPFREGLVLTNPTTNALSWSYFNNEYGAGDARYTPMDNYSGGGAGGWVSMTISAGSGLTGGGARGGATGGNCSTNGGYTNRFTGGAGGGSSSLGGGGGAGFLANGSANSSTTGGNGGSGGGGGGGGGTGSYATSGSGGNGCVLIYY
jgi:hypothetical protein